MKSWKFGSFLLILLVALATAEPEEILEDQGTEIETASEAPAEIQSKGDTGEIDYDSLRTASLKKRSISTIIKLLLGGNVPPNHPLVKNPEPKTWSLANNIVAALPGGHSSYSSSASSLSGWGAPTAAQQIQQLFATKAKILPYTGQVASGLTGIASVKGDILKQIHSLSTQVIAQAAAEAAAKAVASAAAVHAVKAQVASAVHQTPGAIKSAVKSAKAQVHQATKPIIAGYGNNQGWSDYQQAYYSNQQNIYASPEEEKTPGDQPGPPYYSASAPQVQQYQAPAYQNAYPANNNYYAQASQTQNQYQSNNNGAYQQNGGANLLNTGNYQQNTGAYQQPNAYQNAGSYQQAASAAQQQYQQTPQQYNLYNNYNSHSTDTPQSRNGNEYSTLPQSNPNYQQQQQRPRGSGPTFSLPGGTQVQGYNPLSLDTNPTAAATNFNPSALSSPPLLIMSNNNTFDLNSDYFLSAASASVTGRNAKEPPSILSSLATLISASTSAYNALNGLKNPGSVVPTSTPEVSPNNPAAAASNINPLYSRPQPPYNPSGQRPNFPGSGNVFPQQPQSNFNPNWQQRGQGSNNNQAPNSFNSGPQFGSPSAQQPVYTGPVRPNYQQGQNSPSPFNRPSPPFNSQSFSNNNNQFTPAASGNSFSSQPVPGASFSGQYRPGGGGVGSGYPGNNGGAGSSFGYASGFGPQPAGSSPVQASRAPNGNGNGYSNQATRNFNSPPRAFGQQQNNQFNGQTNYPNSQNNYAASNVQTQQQYSQQSAPRQNNGASGFNSPFPNGGQTNGFSGNRNSPINPVDHFQLGSEQINRFELPQSNTHSQFNNNNNNNNNNVNHNNFNRNNVSPNNVNHNNINPNNVVPNNVNHNNFNQPNARPSLKNVKKNKKGSEPSPYISPMNYNNNNPEGHHDVNESVRSSSSSNTPVENAPHQHHDGLRSSISVEQYDDILIAKNPEHKSQTPYNENRWINHPYGQRPHKLHPDHSHKWTRYGPSGEEIDTLPSPTSPSPSTTPTPTHVKHRGHSKSRGKYGGFQKSTKSQYPLREDDRSGQGGTRGSGEGSSELSNLSSLYTTLPNYIYGDARTSGRNDIIREDSRSPSSYTHQGQKDLARTSRRGKDKVLVHINKAIDESAGFISPDNESKISNNRIHNPKIEYQDEEVEPQHHYDDDPETYEDYEDVNDSRTQINERITDTVYNNSNNQRIRNSSHRN